MLAIAVRLRLSLKRRPYHCLTSGNRDLLNNPMLLVTARMHGIARILVPSVAGSNPKGARSYDFR